MVIATKGHFHLPFQETPSLLSDHFWRLLLLAAQDAKPQRILDAPPQETFSTNHLSSHLQQIPQWSLSLHKINFPPPTSQSWLSSALIPRPKALHYKPIAHGVFHTNRCHLL